MMLFLSSSRMATSIHGPDRPSRARAGDRVPGSPARGSQGRSPFAEFAEFALFGSRLSLTLPATGGQATVTISDSARGLALALDLHADQRLPTRFLVEVGQGAVYHGPQGEQHLPMRPPDVAARPGGGFVAQQRPWHVADLIND